MARTAPSMSIAVVMMVLLRLSSAVPQAPGNLGAFQAVAAIAPDLAVFAVAVLFAAGWGVRQAVRGPRVSLDGLATQPARRMDFNATLRAGGLISAALLAVTDATRVDLLWGIGGTPEGVLSAAALKSMGGELIGRLWPRDDGEREAALDAGYDAKDVWRAVCVAMDVPATRFSLIWPSRMFSTS